MVAASGARVRLMHVRFAGSRVSVIAGDVRLQGRMRMSGSEGHREGYHHREEKRGKPRSQ